ncbi:NAD(P)-dependent oxidoreductase [bacterium]|nr:NAD(P)-dependent oxidoreductase [bacterium]
MIENVLVTGGAGFIGSHLVDRLVSLGHQVSVFDCLDPSVHNDSKPPAWLNPKAYFIKGDVTDYSQLKRVIKDKTVIFHFACRKHDSNYEIKRFMDTNVTGITNLLQCIFDTENCCRKLILPSMIGLDKPRALHYGSTYLLSKRIQEDAALQFGKIFKFPVFILRNAHVYGERFSFSEGLGYLIYKLMENKVEKAFSSRYDFFIDFVGVSDVINANIIAMNSIEKGGIFEIGSGVNNSLIFIFKLLSRYLKKDLDLSVLDNFSSKETVVIKSCLEKSINKLGYQPVVNINNGLAKIAEWVNSKEGLELINFARINH